MVRVRTFLLSSLASLLLVPAAGLSSRAEAYDQKGWIGGLLGMTIPNRDKTSARPMWGVSGGAKLGTEYGLGAYYLTSNQDEDPGAGQPKVNFGFDLYGVEAAYHFEGEAKGVYVGGRVGMSKVKVGSASTSPAHFGAVVGYNHFIADNVSIGGEVSYVSVSSSSTTTSGATLDVPSFGLLNFLISAKLWF